LPLVVRHACFSINRQLLSRSVEMQEVGPGKYKKLVRKITRYEKLFGVPYNDSIAMQPFLQPVFCTEWD